ncbi:ATP-binding cassette domain-containing protein [Muricauda sp. 334s03]|uniref:ATP-binding cassette domain-containing protein n=1 Tax=Flagellimonas yonaguniensis TaxID=3031325 RepID=A0ABT5Y2D7_9FLAO|nr:ATP-binding cassette domain-containing protein [[Muricauda] yonaguniensis]MDF0717471.1 ATP-binding cassette domain-containing protein [[Muricauda] yonaguniensis]
MIRTKRLTFKYNNEDTVFKFPDISLNKGQNLLVLGKSGIGKTTLLHLLGGLLRPMDGSIEIDQVPVHSLSNKELDRFRGRNIGLVFQSNHAIQSLNVIENLKARLFFGKKTISQTVIIDLLEQLDILECKNKKVRELSEGQLQRLGIAMAMVHRPGIILADEPTSSLDDDNCNKVIQLLIEQAEINKANLIVITHDQRIKPLFTNKLEL